jgi:hypothetical protein
VLEVGVTKSQSSWTCVAYVKNIVVTIDVA